MTAACNCWIVYEELKHTEIPLIKFLVPLAEQLISTGKSKTQVRPEKGKAHPTERFSHMSEVIKMSRRCIDVLLNMAKNFM